MSDFYRFTVLGCGSSPGVPRPNGDWGKCNPDNPKNRRRRASLLVERVSPHGTTRVVIDTGPDFRAQIIDGLAGKTDRHIDAAIYTHPHADHIHGIDDLRSFVLDSKSLMPIYANRLTLNRLYEAFGYCFATPFGSSYPPILKANEIGNTESFTINGAGGPIRFKPMPMVHGDITSLGFRIENVAYCSDVNEFPPETAASLENLDVLLIDALQYRPHPSHFSLDEALEWISRLKPHRAILTHMHVPLDYDEVRALVPENVEPAYDGMVFEVPANH
ncbi:MBL fold metallo-hydrolase [Pseudochrobactrum sp. Wa41.01b-1]|uniref:MBL fold metallo-hydrolase n=1 Tax=Pseudochrobactrum sp. Wa41.01b-1 TaxID=2864102 RepID=UPI001C68A952|nr:MBL fold metallo-hydrolase [Pseudochrobactrum sp. Wa41.01b-1]QYM73258.1 MBL fold metallo-hydrolase [Pseudochrobactrum sp. Wa41.01b-1]